MNSKASTMRKLYFLQHQIQQVKSDYKNIKSSLNQFTFNSLLQKKGERERSPYDKKLKKTMEKDKENISFKQNISIEEDSDKKYLEIDPKGLLKKKQNFLKQAILNELNQIKILQKKQEVKRKISERIKQQNSQRKREYESRSKEKQRKIREIQEIIIQKSQKTSVTHSNISINIPISIQLSHKSLKCPNNHEYYEGNLNHRKQPHGNGRFQNCCSKCPNIISYDKIEDLQFYQGEFKDGKFDGFGTLSYKGGVKYVGQFRRGCREGKGSLYFKGKAETAKWQSDKYIALI